MVIVTKGITQKMIDLFHANIDYPCLIITENEQNGDQLFILIKMIVRFTISHFGN